MANFPNSKAYRTSGVGNAGAAASPRPTQGSQRSQAAGRTDPPIPMPVGRDQSDVTVWPWVIAFALVLFIFPVQTLVVVAVLVAATFLLGKG